jgi:HK97 family phage major capsid protein
VNTQVLKALWEKRNKILTDIQTQSYISEGREPTEEEKQFEERMTADLVEVDGKISKGIDEVEREQRAAATFDRFERLVQGGGLKDAPERQLEVATSLRSFLKGERRDWTYDLDSQVVDAYDIRSRSWETRAAGTLTEATAGMPLPRSFSGQLYEAFVQAAAVLRAKGASNSQDTLFLTSTGEPLDVPRALAHGAAGWTGEGVNIGTGSTDPTLSFITLNSYKAGQLVQVSRELVDDEGFDIVGYIARAAGRNCGLLADGAAGYTTGAGTTQPTGFVGAAAIGVTQAGTFAGTGGVPTYANLIDMYYSILDSYRENAVWMATNGVIAQIAKVVDGQGRPLWMPGLVPGQPDTLLGRPILVNAAMPVPAISAKTIAFGDFGGYAVRVVRGVRFERSDEFAFGTDLVTFKALLRTDGKTIDTNAVKVFQNPTS